MTAWGVDHEHVLPWRLAAAAAHLVRGDQEAAVDVVDERGANLTADGGPARADDTHRSAREHVYDTLSGGVECGEVIESIRLLTRNEAAPPSPRPARYRIEDRFSRYLDKLTFSERKVAVLAAKGSSNRVIARSLSLSISTVEQHLTHTYKKLGVSGRQQLRAKLG
ncbi:LuxR C-terminal-related transcriptional regulator [Streptomyces sp. NPDC050560]|uniref:helix-turn-helix transcriptional regulator n=1 Tax=Streptomyces sp. NPDC050560 TaxID=3365630 RepID=UPI00378EDA88